MTKHLALVLVVLGACAVIAQTPAPKPVPAVLQNYPAVTAEQLKTPADGDWLMVRRRLRDEHLRSHHDDERDCLSHGLKTSS